MALSSLVAVRQALVLRLLRQRTPMLPWQVLRLLSAGFSWSAIHHCVLAFQHASRRRTCCLSCWSALRRRFWRPSGCWCRPAMHTPLVVVLVVLLVVLLDASPAAMPSLLALLLPCMPRWSSCSSKVVSLPWMPLSTHRLVM